MALSWYLESGTPTYLSNVISRSTTACSPRAIRLARWRCLIPGTLTDYGCLSSFGGGKRAITDFWPLFAHGSRRKTRHSARSVIPLFIPHPLILYPLMALVTSQLAGSSAGSRARLWHGRESVPQQGNTIEVAQIVALKRGAVVCYGENWRIVWWAAGGQAHFSASARPRGATRKRAEK